MQRRYRVFPGKRRRRGGLLWVPPPVPPPPYIPFIIHQHRKARKPVHRRHGHLLWTPDSFAGPPPAVAFTLGEPYFRWTAGTPHLS